MISFLSRDTPIYDKDQRLVVIIGSIPSEMRVLVKDLTSDISEFTEGMGDRMKSAGRRGDFKCAEHGMSHGGGQTVCTGVSLTSSD